MSYEDMIFDCGIVPVVVLTDGSQAVPLAKALLAGGIDFMEITFRTACCLDSIRLVKENVPEMHVGAGTVLSLDQAKSAVDAGAEFIVSPGIDEDTVSWCVSESIPVIPGCATPTEIMKAMKLGLTTVKFFPANLYGGIKGIKALSAPFGGIRFLPTGGVSQDNLAEFLELPSVLAAGGSWICTKKDITEGNYDLITELAKKAVAVKEEKRR